MLLSQYKYAIWVGLLWLGFTAWGAFDIRLGYFISVIYRKKTKYKKIAITFDDGPTEYTPKVLALLKQYNAKATFFCIGKQLEKYPVYAKQIIAEGHQLGNHSYSHASKFGFFSAKQIEEELKKTTSIIEKISGNKNYYFRPPFGVTNPHIAQAVKKTGLKVIGWNIRSLDTVIEGETKILNRIVKKIKPGGIILLHDTSEKTVRVLEQLLPILQEQKYQLQNLDKFLADD